jgi:hypothetical protein
MAIGGHPPCFGPPSSADAREMGRLPHARCGLLGHSFYQ